MEPEKNIIDGIDDRKGEGLPYQKLSKEEFYKMMPPGYEEFLKKQSENTSKENVNQENVRGYIGNDDK